jgi:hypothetical protein
MKIAHWIQLDSGKCKCSNCETIAMIALHPPGADKNFCPNCGAKMGSFDLDELKSAVVKISKYCAFFETSCDGCCFNKNNKCLFDYTVNCWKRKLEERESEG